MRRYLFSNGTVKVDTSAFRAVEPLARPAGQQFVLVLVSPVRREHLAQQEADPTPLHVKPTRKS